MAEDCRCQNCGNAGRFTVVVTNERVKSDDGKTLLRWCRNACSRMCGEILGIRGARELEMLCGYTVISKREIRPMLTTTGASEHAQT